MGLGDELCAEKYSRSRAVVDLDVSSHGSPEWVKTEMAEESQCCNSMGKGGVSDSRTHQRAISKKLLEFPTDQNLVVEAEMPQVEVGSEKGDSAGGWPQNKEGNAHEVVVEVQDFEIMEKASR